MLPPTSRRCLRLLHVLHEVGRGEEGRKQDRVAAAQRKAMGFRLNIVFVHSENNDKTGEGTGVTKRNREAVRAGR